MNDFDSRMLALVMFTGMATIAVLFIVIPPLVLAGLAWLCGFPSLTFYLVIQALWAVPWCVYWYIDFKRN